MTRGRIVPVVLAVALTVGCGGEAGTSPGSPANASSGAGVPSRVGGTGNARADAAGTLAPGLMAVVHRRDRTDVLVFSAETGELDDHRAIVYSGPSPAPPIGRANFSDDGRFVVWATGGGPFGAPCGDVHLAELDGRGATYREAARWQPPETSFSQGAICFQDPRFQEGSTVIRVLAMDTGEVPASEDRHPGPEPASVWTVDVERRGDAPEHVEDLTDDDIARDVPVDVTGVADGSGEMSATASQVERVRVHVTNSPEGLPHDGSTYACRTGMDDTTMLCLREGGSGLFGSVATARVDMRSATVRLREVAPVSAADVTGALVSPDHKAVLIATDDGWYRADIDGSSEPQFAFDSLVDPASPEPIQPQDVEWID